MRYSPDKDYSRPGLFSNLNKVVFEPDKVYKYYGTGTAKLILFILSKSPFYMNESMSPEERKINEETTLRKLYAKGLPVPKVIHSGFEYIVMKRIYGIPLPQIYTSSHIRRSQKVRLTESLGKLVRRMHNEGVVHGDLAIKQFLLEPGSKHSDLRDTIDSGDFKLYVIDFETMPKKGGQYGRTVDNILCTFSASCMGNLPYSRVRTAYEKGYGGRIDHGFFSRDPVLRASLFWYTIVLTKTIPSVHRYMEMTKVLSHEM